MKEFNIIVAMDIDRGIGKNGTLPWQLSGDMKHFKEITTTTVSKNKQNAVIMGRKTWDSIPPKFKPLPGRKNIVISRNSQLVLPAGVLLAANLNAAFQSINKEIESVFVIGGAELFKETINAADCKKLYITHIAQSFGCDVFFPAIPATFHRVVQSPPSSEAQMNYYFAEYQKAS